MSLLAAPTQQYMLQVQATADGDLAAAPKRMLKQETGSQEARSSKLQDGPPKATVMSGVRIHLLADGAAAHLLFCTMPHVCPGPWRGGPGSAYMGSQDTMHVQAAVERTLRSVPRITATAVDHLMERYRMLDVRFCTTGTCAAMCARCHSDLRCGTRLSACLVSGFASHLWRPWRAELQRGVVSGPAHAQTSAAV